MKKLRMPTSATTMTATDTNIAIILDLVRTELCGAVDGAITPINPVNYNQYINTCDTIYCGILS